MIRGAPSAPKPRWDDGISPAASEISVVRGAPSAAKPRWDDGINPAGAVAAATVAALEGVARPWLARARARGPSNSYQ